MTASRDGFWVTNHLANPILRLLLRGPLGRRLGRRLAVLRYEGRRTGQTHELVAQYVRDGDRVWIVPGQPERKRWWRNMLEPRAMELWLAGEHARGIARAITHPSAEMTEGFARYRSTFAGATQASVIVRVDVEVRPA